MAAKKSSSKGKAADKRSLKDLSPKSRQSKEVAGGGVTPAQTRRPMEAQKMLTSVEMTKRLR